MIQRAAHILAGGAWCLPGGAIEKGEHAREAIVREMREEVGLAIEPLQELWQCEKHEGRLVLHWWLIRPAVADDYRLSPNPDEVAQALWLTPAEILNLPNLLDSNHKFFQHLAEHPIPPIL